MAQPNGAADEQLTAAQAKIAELEARLSSVAENKQEILAEHAQLKETMRQMKAAEEERKKKGLEEDGQLGELLKITQEELSTTKQALTDARNEIEELKTGFERKSEADQMRSEFVRAAGPRAYAPDQLWDSVGRHAKRVDGKTVIAVGGATYSPEELVKKLMQPDSGYAHNFRPEGGGQGGMGTASSPARGIEGLPEGAANPWVTGNVTHQTLLALDNPDLAAKLRAEAQVALAAAQK